MVPPIKQGYVSVPYETKIAETPSVGRPPYTRRLSDKVFAAFHHACDGSDIEEAQLLLSVMEHMVHRPSAIHKRKFSHLQECIVAGHKRLWDIQNPFEPH